MEQLLATLRFGMLSEAALNSTGTKKPCGPNNRKRRIILRKVSLMRNISDKEKLRKGMI